MPLCTLAQTCGRNVRAVRSISAASGSLKAAVPGYSSLGS